MALVSYNDARLSYGEFNCVTNAKAMVNNDILFTIPGPILILSLCSECVTANDATASTLQYRAGITVPAANTTISGASATLASAIVGTLVCLDGTAVTTAPNIYTGGGGLAMVSRPLIMLAGNIHLVIGVGSTTGTWKHYLKYKPLTSATLVTNTQ